MGLTTALALTLSGCLVEDPNASSGGGGLGGFADGGSADGDGEVTIQGQFGGAEQEGLEAALEPFEEESGIDVQYESVPDFTTVIKLNAESGSSPDIGLFPQPGVLFELAETGHIQPIDTFLDFDTLAQTLVPGTLEVGRLNGRYYGAPFRLALKSMVFYPKKAYEQAGYPKEPSSLQEMEQIADDMKADGANPWCMGFQDAANTGWVGTDWIEELVLRMHGPQVYDQWVSHDIPFDDERIVAALERFQELLLDDDNTYGGSRGILNTPFGESFTPAFDSPAKCYWHRQGSFIISDAFLPGRIASNVDEEIGLFVLPPEEGGFGGQPVMGAGDVAALFNGDDEEAQQVMEFLTSDEFGVPWAQAGGYLSPHITFPVDEYSDSVTKEIARVVAEADAFRFDASDVMPPAVGADAFWTGMIDLVDGKDPEDVASDIEDAWPSEGE